jgi:predicted ATP-dependent endonuclease of OLD family
LRNDEISLEKHVNKRIEDYRTREGSSSWLSLFFGDPVKSQIDSVFQKIGNSVTREVIGSWSKIFQRPSGAKSISVEWGVDTQVDNLPYVSFFVSDGESKYAVSERSLGFRWFFSFLLFTAFKQNSKRPTLFLFDEPAANLHAKAQAELLKSFSRITSGNNQIIYSTHSHHMINPQWLSAAYIVENKAVDYDSEDSYSLNSRSTNIIATPYRKFVSESPNRTSYFQPVVEQLSYVSPEIIGTQPYVLLEGITDYYALRFVREHFAKEFHGLSLMPGAGAGASGPMISLLLGRGEKFIILLDDDAAGRAAAVRYRDEWFLPANAVQTLSDVHKDFERKKLETLLGSELGNIIKEKLNKTKAPSKKEIGLYLSEICATRADLSAIGNEASTSLHKLLSLLQEKVSSL